MSSYSIIYQLAIRAYLTLLLVRIWHDLGTITLIPSCIVKITFKVIYFIYIKGRFNRRCKEFQGPHLREDNNLYLVYWLCRLWPLASRDLNSLKPSFVDNFFDLPTYFRKIDIMGFLKKLIVISTNIIILIWQFELMDKSFLRVMELQRNTLLWIWYHECRLPIILMLGVVGTLLTNIKYQYSTLPLHWCGPSCNMVMR